MSVLTDHDFAVKEWHMVNDTDSASVTHRFADVQDGRIQNRKLLKSSVVTCTHIAPYLY